MRKKTNYVEEKVEKSVLLTSFSFGDIWPQYGKQKLRWGIIIQISPFLHNTHAIGGGK